MKEVDKLVKSLGDSFDSWEHIRTQGGSDPFHSDGTNMNLVKNHIMFYKRQIEELCDQKCLELPDIYYKATPPEVDINYMARVDEIRENANKALKEYKANEDYQYLVKIIVRLNIKEIKKSAIDNVLKYCWGLEHHINKDNLIAMRRHENYKHYLESFRNCKIRIEKMLDENPKEGQVSFFEI